MQTINLYQYMLQLSIIYPNLSIQDILTKSRIALDIPFISIHELQHIDLTKPPTQAISEALKIIENESVREQAARSIRRPAAIRPSGKNGLFTLLLLELSRFRRFTERSL